MPDTPETLAKISADIAAINSEAEAVRLELQKSDERRKAERRRDLTYIAIPFVVLIVLAGYIGWTVSDSKERGREAQRQRAAILSTLQIVKDCTGSEPTECRQRVQANTASAIAAIVDADHNGKLDSQEILENQKLILKRLGE